MPSFEEVCRKIINEPEFGSRFLIGGLLSFIPVVNFFSLGYLFRYSKQVRNEDNYGLLPWDNWTGLFIDGLKLFLIVLVFAGIPLIAALLLVKLLALLLYWIGLGIFSKVPLAFVLLVAPALCSAALYRYQSSDSPKDLFRFDIIFVMLTKNWPQLLIPALSFCGLMLVGAPLYGFAFFLGFLVILAYHNAVFKALEKKAG